MTPQQIENKIRELVPELQELSFGCEVIYSHKGNKRPVYFEKWVAEGEALRIFDKALQNPNVIHTIKIGEIIGHPIHLEHLLLAIERLSKEKGFDLCAVIQIPTMGSIRFSKMYDSEKNKADYNLTKSFSQNLQDSPELTTLLSDVLDVI